MVQIIPKIFQSGHLQGVRKQNHPLGVLLKEGAAGLALLLQIPRIVRLGQLDFRLAELQRGNFLI